MIGDCDVVGEGTLEQPLSEDAVARILRAGLGPEYVAGQRILVIIPDGTRTAPLPLFFRLLCEQLTLQAKRLDFIVALGTHQPLSAEALCTLVGITRAERKHRYADIGIFNHAFDTPGQLMSIGKVSAGEVGEITGGLLEEDIQVTINRAILDYDLLLVCGPTFPHELAGFSGGNKYFFPGISGGDMIDVTHWLGALLGCSRVIGELHTPVRAILDRAARLIPRPRRCASMVVGAKGLMGLYVGPAEKAWEAAARLSQQLHITWVPNAFESVLAVIPSMYEDLWTGSKGFYKLEPAMADGGELVLYAPHIREFSYTHGEFLDQIGFRSAAYLRRHWDRYRNYPWAILAHSALVRGSTTMSGAEEQPRVKLTLASGIGRERCERMGLRYLSPEAVHVDAWRGREQEGVHLIEHAGEQLYRVRDMDRTSH